MFLLFGESMHIRGMTVNCNDLFLLKSRVMQRNFSLRGDMKSRFSFIPQFDVGD